MKIQGFQKLTLLDFPTKTACTVFTAGCNFRCPFCHNASLVNCNGQEPQVGEDEFFSFLKKRFGILDGVCITGGEPTLQNGLEDFIKRIKDMGYAVKLDTNGSFADKLISIASKGLLDYVAMDIKSSPENYPKLCGVNADMESIKASVEFLKSSSIPHEFRTTAVKGLHDIRDFEEISKWIGDESYFIQCFVDSGDVLTDGCEAFTPDELRKIAEAVKPNTPRVALRGI